MVWAKCIKARGDLAHALQLLYKPDLLVLSASGKYVEN